MKIILHGTRGSIPVPSPDTQYYGGNTTCIEILTNAKDRIIIDAGSGIHTLGEKMMTQENQSFHLCFTHAHWDHLLGFSMFAPIFSESASINIHAEENIGQKGIYNALGKIMDSRYFPVNFDNLPARISIHEFPQKGSFSIGSALVETCPTNHPGGCTAYRITADGWSFFFSGDHEYPLEDCPAANPVTELMHGADVALVDATYTEEEYATRKGWGHSTFTAWPKKASDAGVKLLVFSHHAPSRTDRQLDELRLQLKQDFSHLPVTLEMACEDMVFSGPEEKDWFIKPHPSTSRKHSLQPDASLFQWMNDFSRELAQYDDMGVLMDRILQEARRITFADAGTIFLLEEDHLVFANIHNDTLFPGSAANKYAYAATHLPLNNTSVAGYVAIEKKLLNIEDMYQLPRGVPYHFNASLDEATGYKTVSTLTVPITGKNDEILGVIQLINSQPEALPKPFSQSMEIQIQLLANSVASTIEKAHLTRDFILRMLRMAALRDPHETGPHVERVGSYSAEIYHRWAERHNVDIDQLRYEKSLIRMAAMLHDVGKIGIADKILKKPGKLDDQEYAAMQKHCALGADIFGKKSTAMDQLAYEVAMHHHQKWDGTGYTGTPDIPLLSGEDIPLAARITAVADVYDALSSKRCYKDAWPQSKVMEIMRKDAGTHFDPEIVSCLEEIMETIEAIREKYPDDAPPEE